MNWGTDFHTSLWKFSCKPVGTRYLFLLSELWLKYVTSSSSTVFVISSEFATLGQIPCGTAWGSDFLVFLSVPHPAHSGIPAEFRRIQDPYRAKHLWKSLLIELPYNCSYETQGEFNMAISHCTRVAQFQQLKGCYLTTENDRMYQKVIYTSLGFVWINREQWTMLQTSSKRRVKRQNLFEFLQIKLLNKTHSFL